MAGKLSGLTRLWATGNQGVSRAGAAILAIRAPIRRAMVLGLFSTSVVVAQVAKPEADSLASLNETETGIPVTDSLTIAKCGSCHAADAKGNLSRISWSRTTPEGWSQAIKRMVRLNGLSITAEESRAIVKYLSGAHGLAPEEAKPVMYMPERRTIDETNIPNETVRTSCAACHGFGQALSWRRSKVEWKLLQNLHVALYSQADAQYRRPSVEPGDQPPPGQTPPAKPRTAGEVGLEYISKTAPLATPEWTAWRPRLRPAKLAGKWLVSATVPGQGRYVGEMTIAAGKDEDSFVTSVALQPVAGGAPIIRQGSGIVYGGYSWRGRSTAGAPKDAGPADAARDTRETMWFSPDQKMATGRWFWGEYHEFGYDVTLTRATGAPTIFSVVPDALKAGTKAVQLRILGDSLPSGLKPSDIDVGAGVTVTQVLSSSPTEVVVAVDVATDATAGRRDVGIAGATMEKALPVYRKVDYLKVTPETSVSRLGGVKFAKGYQQYDAIGFDNGPDAKPYTSDDLAIGPVDVDWSVEEFLAVTYDDDKKFVGTLSQAALFTPSTEGPNPARRFGRNNYGDVWVVATAKAEKDKFGKPLTAKSYLVVTVPAYQRWDQPEVGQ
ncbi:quinohemoprotein amine dehydrogenase subunit alpha [Sphingobium algorifonticola]|uniref:Quinohemoprotein amine dehydrogenase subunit alpha n=2 Tax=Sphingobium algorifonticola TaxID=2008318 RepID=A0A437J7Q3_9SPHN|nr:quinohemoprotein amine dehydrogenase subunit alpha [Sphingobium algorifonticola]